MKHFQAALQFLTSLPIGKSHQFEAHQMIRYFPLVGLLIGALTAIFDILFRWLWPVPIAGFLDLTLLILLTGALHLDGLSDTADGIFSHRTKDKILDIMKDSRVGVMGVVSLVVVLGIKWCGLSSIEAQRSLLIFLIPGYARATSLIGFASLPYGRPEGGLGEPFFQQPISLTSFWWPFLILIIPSVFLGWKGLLLNLFFVIIVALSLIFIKKRLGCLTGDILGAMIELTEAVLFLTMSLSI